MIHKIQWLEGNCLNFHGICMLSTVGSAKFDQIFEWMVTFKKAISCLNNSLSKNLSTRLGWKVATKTSVSVLGCRYLYTWKNSVSNPTPSHLRVCARAWACFIGKVLVLVSRHKLSAKYPSSKPSSKRKSHSSPSSLQDEQWSWIEHATICLEALTWRRHGRFLCLFATGRRFYSKWNHLHIKNSFRWKTSIKKILELHTI